jgi:hypothetical protein
MVMDLIYLALAAVGWVVVIALAWGCQRLAPGAKQ